MHGEYGKSGGNASYSQIMDLLEYTDPLFDRFRGCRSRMHDESMSHWGYSRPKFGTVTSELHRLLNAVPLPWKEVLKKEKKRARDEEEAGRSGKKKRHLTASK
jgi:hypothetical protein